MREEMRDGRRSEGEGTREEHKRAREEKRRSTTYQYFRLLGREGVPLSAHHVLSFQMNNPCVIGKDIEAYPMIGDSLTFL